MSDKTGIEWTDATWNFVTGCTRISEGCDHCYIERTPPFRMAHRKFNGTGVGSTTGVKHYSDRLGIPLRWRNPRRVFVNSLSDLFHEDVDEQLVAEALAVMALTPQHTYQLLTKRHARMRSYLSNPLLRDQVEELVCERAAILYPKGWEARFTWPLRNLWLGVTVESQKWADIRIPYLRDTPAAVRFISAEPLLGPVDLSGHLPKALCAACEANMEGPMCSACYGDFRTRIGWVIVGGESGPGARPMHPDWVRSLRDQCTAAGVAFHFKQFGEWVPESFWTHRDNAQAAYLSKDGRVRPLVKGIPTEAPYSRGDDMTVRRVGKHHAGRELDGRTWDEYPAAL